MSINFKLRSFIVKNGSWHVYNHYFGLYIHQYGLLSASVRNDRPDFINHIKRNR